MVMHSTTSQPSRSGHAAAPASWTPTLSPPGQAAALLACVEMSIAQAQTALAALGGGSRAASSVARAAALVREDASAGMAHGPGAVAVLGAPDAGPALELLEQLRAAGSRASVLAAHASLAPFDAAILQEAGVELIAGVSPERQARSLCERLAATPELQGPRRGERRQDLALDELAAGSGMMARAAAQGRRALRAGLPVLIEGEAGAGKLALARALHAASLRRQRPLWQFGPEAVAAGFTLAANRLGVDLESGLVNGEAGGSLYLRDIGAWPDHAQAELTGLLRRRNARHDRDGGARGLRIFAAVRSPLIELVRAGAVRDDLYYLLSVAPIALSPLRAMRPDIPGLACAMLARLRTGRAAALRPNFPVQLEQEALEALAAEDWPGNIAQLRARLHLAASRARGDAITAAHVAPPEAGAMADDGWVIAWPDDALQATAGENRDMAAPAGAGPEAPASDLLDIFDGHGELKPLAEIEAGVIRFAVRHYRGQMSEVSRRLGIGRSTLYRKLRDLDLLPDRAPPLAGEDFSRMRSCPMPGRLSAQRELAVENEAARS